MSALRNLIGGLTVGCFVITGFYFASQTGAWAAESYASSMAGTMQESGAISDNASLASTDASSEFSGNSTSNNSTYQATHAAAYDSSLTGAGPGLAFKNVVGPGALDSNLVVPNPGVRSLPGSAPATASVRVVRPGTAAGVIRPATALSRGKPAFARALIENDVKQKPSDFVTNGGARSRTAANIPAHVPAVKIQYWNQNNKHRVF